MDLLEEDSFLYLPPEEAEVIQHGLNALQVCVPVEWTKKEAEAFANRADPTGISSQWKVVKAGDKLLLGTPVKVCCEERTGFVHYVLKC